MAKHYNDRVVGSNFEVFVVKWTRFGQPIDLTGATSTFTMETKDGVTKPIDDQPCAAGTDDGRVVFQATTAQLITPEDYWCRTKTVMPGGEQLISERIGLLIRDDL